MQVYQSFITLESYVLVKALEKVQLQPIALASVIVLWMREETELSLPFSLLSISVFYSYLLPSHSFTFPCYAFPMWSGS